MSDKHPLDEYFKEGLGEHKMKPSEAVWEKIQAAQPAPPQRKGGWYIMRAAVIVLLIGLSTVFYYQNNLPGEDWVNTEVEHKVADPEKKSKDKGQEKEQGDKEQKTETEKNVEKPNNKAVPIMRQNTGRKIYVANDEILQPIDERLLADESEDVLMADVSLKVEQKAKPAPLKVKFKVAPKAATEGFYANNDKPEEKREAFKDKVYAYANNQFDNIKNGRPVELPKPDKKPQLEIDLGRIFNN